MKDSNNKQGFSTSKLAGNSMLLLAAFFWGIAFVAQSSGMDYMEPFTFNGVRSLMGTLVLIPVIFVFDKKNGRKNHLPTKMEWIGGTVCGAICFAATSFQQFGLLTTSAGKAGFITALYIILIPIIGLFMKKKAPAMVWVSAITALAGLFFLCVTEEFSLERGDILVLICAFIFSWHIIAIDYFSPKVDGVRLSCIQFLVAGLLSMPGMFIFETPTISGMLAGWLPLCYAGIFSCGVAYTLQIIGQRYTAPTIASILMSFESVFSVIFGAIILHQYMSGKEILGCVLMFIAIILAQVDFKELFGKRG